MSLIKSHSRSTNMSQQLCALTLMALILGYGTFAAPQLMKISEYTQGHNIVGCSWLKDQLDLMLDWYSNQQTVVVNSHGSNTKETKQCKQRMLTIVKQFGTRMWRNSLRGSEHRTTKSMACIVSSILWPGDCTGVGSGGGKVEVWKYCVNGDYNFRNGSGMAELLKYTTSWALCQAARGHLLNKNNWYFLSWTNWTSALTRVNPFLTQFGLNSLATSTNRLEQGLTQCLIKLSSRNVMLNHLLMRL